MSKNMVQYQGGSHGNPKYVMSNYNNHGGKRVLDAGQPHLSLNNTSSTKDRFLDHTMSKEEHDKRKVREQIKVYFLTYFAYALIHIQREFWALSKAIIIKDP